MLKGNPPNESTFKQCAWAFLLYGGQNGSRYTDGQCQIVHLSSTRSAVTHAQSRSAEKLTDGTRTGKQMPPHSIWLFRRSRWDRPNRISVTYSNEVWRKAEANETSEAHVSGRKSKGAPRNSIIKDNNILI